MRCAANRAMFLSGAAGQGKTHLFCDAAQARISEGKPALVLLGQRFASRNPWASIAEQLGLGHVGREVIVGGIEAAAEASNGRFLVLIDALNEAEDASLWRAELRPLQAALTKSGWVGLAVSCRSSYMDVVVPDEGLQDIFAVVDHPGFAGREFEAIERFFAVYDFEMPKVPFLVPEFSNPLFLKLYCVGLKAL